MVEFEEIRIGVYICHCGLNIAGVVDCKKVSEYAGDLPDVVLSRHNSYTCSEPGQNQIKQDIADHRLNRIVVAACSPRLHEPTFRQCISEAGLNPYLFEMANLREHCSWVHGHDKAGATQKACDLVRAAVARSRLLEVCYEKEIPVNRSAMVIGGGVAGIQTALDLANAGIKVILVEKKPSTGGIMAALDKTFPTMDCSICILGPKMTDVGRHPNITLLTMSEVKAVTGFVGNFNVRVLKRARYVREDMCTACGECAKVCPVVLPDEFNVGLASRRAIYSPFPQAVPSAYLVETDRKRPISMAFIQCVGFRSLRRGESYCSNVCCMNTIKCTFMLKEHYENIEVKVFYIDIRAFGKGFEDLFRRTKRMGVKYIRGLPGSVEEDPETGDLILKVENTASNKVETHRVEMVVLAVGVKPPSNIEKIREMLALQKNPDGFFLEAHPKLQPVDAAMRASILMSRGSLKAEAITAEVNPEICTSCGLCAQVCPYKAIKVDKHSKIPAHVTTAACAGCGTCSAECPEGAIEMHHFSDRQIEAQIDAMLQETQEDRILVFACNWCSYAGADFASVSRLEYPANTRLIRTMCSGRVGEKFLWRAFKKGAPVVLVSGCHLSDCHYNNANHWTQRRIKRMWNKMEKLGIRKERLQLEWISAAEGIRFQQAMEKMERLRKSVTQEEITETKKIIAE